MRRADARFERPGRDKAGHCFCHVHEQLIGPLRTAPGEPLRRLIPEVVLRTRAGSAGRRCREMSGLSPAVPTSIL
jgi:hypothetical protein